MNLPYFNITKLRGILSRRLDNKVTIERFESVNLKLLKLVIPIPKFMMKFFVSLKSVFFSLKPSLHSDRNLGFYNNFYKFLITISKY